MLFGATGFTGALTARYLAANQPPGLRWALAGRNRAKLEALRSELDTDVDIVEADIGNPASVRRLAESSRAVATTRTARSAVSASPARPSASHEA